MKTYRIKGSFVLTFLQRVSVFNFHCGCSSTVNYLWSWTESEPFSPKRQNHFLTSFEMGDTRITSTRRIPIWSVWISVEFDASRKCGQRYNRRKLIKSMSSFFSWKFRQKKVPHTFELHFTSLSYGAQQYSWTK